MLISPEARDRKPYAIPVQLIPYTGLAQAQIRDIIIKEMVMRDMDISGLCIPAEINMLANTYMYVNVFAPSEGFVANGEFNALRSIGYTRPLSVLRIKSDVRSKYARMGKKKMMRMITPKGQPNMRPGL